MRIYAQIRRIEIKGRSLYSDSVLCMRVIRANEKWALPTYITRNYLIKRYILLDCIMNLAGIMY